jgi:hypothetical protein
VGRHLAGGVRDVHDPRGGGAFLLAAEDAVPEPEVQWRPDHDHQVGTAERDAPRLGHQELVAARHDAPAHPVGQGRDPEVLHEPECGLLGTVGPHVRAEDEHGLPSVGQQPCDRRQRVAVRVDPLALGGLRCRAGGGVEELVHRHVDERRPAVRAAGSEERLVHAGEDFSSGGDGAGQLGHRLDDGRLVELLETAAAPAVLRRPSADDDHR